MSKWDRTDWALIQALRVDGNGLVQKGGEDEIDSLAFHMSEVLTILRYCRQSHI